MLVAARISACITSWIACHSPRKWPRHAHPLLLELDGLDSNAEVRKHVWGPGSDGWLGGLNLLLAIR